MTKLIFEETGIELSEEFWAVTREKRIRALADNLKPVQQIDQALEKLNLLEIKYCIASSSEIERINRSLNTVRLKHYFDDSTIFSSSMVSRGKPEPDIFLHTASQMKVDPQHCVVIEDSIVGIKAAHAAGMRTVALLSAQHTKYPWHIESVKKEKPTNIAHSIDEVLTLLL